MNILKNIIKKNILVLLISTGFVGCSLEPELTSNYTEDVLWKNETNVNLYLNSFYPLICSDYYHSAIAEDGYSDIVKMTLPHASQNLWAFGALPIDQANNVFDNWSWGYTWITQLNRFLSGLENKGGHLPKALQERAEAEVRFFRAHVYFQMARRYGANLIIYKKLPPLGEKNHALGTPEECWNFIEEDLLFAATYLPDKDAVEQGRLTKGAAWGLMARAMLYAERWEAASNAAKAVMDMGYDLYPDYKELFKFRRSEKKENKESVLEFGYIKSDFTYTFDGSYCPPGDNGYAEAVPTENLVSEYEMADGSQFSWNQHGTNPYEGRESRFYASILYDGAAWKGRILEAFEGGRDGWGLGGNTTSTGYYIRKFMDEEMTELRENDYTFYYMRFAEVLLIYAEAMAKQGFVDEGLVALNRVRNRVHLPKVHAVTIDQFMILLRHERMVEFAFEGHRFWDLRRWDLAKNTLNNTALKGIKPIRQGDGTIIYEEVDCDNGKTRIYLDKYKRFPIPYSELKANEFCEQFEEWK